MTNSNLHKTIRSILVKKGLKKASNQQFIDRLIGKAELSYYLFSKLYSSRDDSDESFTKFIELIIVSHEQREPRLKERDKKKNKENGWFLNHKLVGMSLYVDRFAKNIKGLSQKIDYLENLGVNFLHLMPLFESPKEASDGGYSVSNYRKVDKRFGALNDLKKFQHALQDKDMYLMLDLVLNHTSDQHEWAQKAKKGSTKYQDYYYVYSDRAIPNQMETHMPEVFPESSPGSFTYNNEMEKWVMTVFHNYQWDLNFANPKVFLEMLQIVFLYANLGVDVLRIDAPAFIWKKMGTSCQNLPEAHMILQLIKAALEIAAPGMAILGEAIVAPREIMGYFGSGYMVNKECDIAYNASQMALQWDALATSDTRNMLCNQDIIQQKPEGCTWINYTRCHDDIGLTFEDRCIEQAGYNPGMHRDFLKNYYSGKVDFSPSVGELFAVNPLNNDARISGSLASLCGLEKAIQLQDNKAIETAIDKIILMQASSILLGGIPMLFYGDEVGYTNDYSYKNDPDKSYDNRWMHRPIIDWKKNSKAFKKGTIENEVFSGIQSLLNIRKEHYLFSDFNNVEWLNSYNRSVVGFIRKYEGKQMFCLFNYSPEPQNLTYYIFDSVRKSTTKLYDLWSKSYVKLGKDHEHLLFKPYQFYVLKSS